jgi:phosphate transport system protein
MDKGSSHIVTRFDDELRRLSAQIAEMGGLVEEQLLMAVNALSRQDLTLAEKVIASDKRVDLLEQELEEGVVRLLALRQPMAKDLREIICALKVAHNLERMGDFARNTAKRAITLSQVEFQGPVSTINALGRMVSEMVHDVVEAYLDQDLERAALVRARDEDVDAFHSGIFRELLTYMMESPRNITGCTHLMFIAKNLERVGDHATNMAEALHFLVTGKPVDTERGKADNSSLETAADLHPRKDA